MNKTLSSSPNDIVESNITRSKVTISWVTEVSERGQVNYGTTPSLGSTVYDERGETFEGRTHYVTIEALEPNTLYYYDIVSGGTTYDNGGAYFTVTTGAILSPLADTDIAYGQVFLNDGTTPAQDAIVYIRLKDNDGLGTQGESQMRSYLISTNGYWYLDLKNIRNTILDSYFNYSETGDSLVLDALGPGGESGSKVVDTSQDSPASPLIIRFDSAPVLALIGDKSVNIGALLEFTISASDIDNNRLIFSSSGLPQGAALADHGNGTATFSWMPGIAQIGTHTVTFTVSDGGLSDSETITIAVVNPIPAAPSNLTASFAYDIAVKLTWTDNSDNEHGFIVEMKAGSGQYIQFPLVSAGITRLIDAGTVANTTYTYRVCAYNAVGSSSYSTISITTPPPPVAPSNLIATYNVSKNQVELAWAWTGDPNKIEGFRIERLIGAGSYVRLYSPANTTQYNDTAIVPGATYTYKMYAYKGGALSGYSNEVNVTTNR